AKWAVAASRRANHANHATNKGRVPGWFLGRAPCWWVLPPLCQRRQEPSGCAGRIHWRGAHMERQRRLLLVRHALPEIVPGVAPHNRRLAAEGRRRAGALGEQLAEGGSVSSVIASSVELKAHETAELIAQCFALPVEDVMELHERERRDATQMFD